MEQAKALKVMFALAVMGFLFSGYLTFSRLIMQTCPLNEPCAIFLGLPTCIYGFVMFSLMLIFSGAGAFLKKASGQKRALIKGNLAVSLAGILFAGYFSVKEIFFTECIGGACKYSLGLPSCTYGLVFFIAIFALSARALAKK